MGEQFSIVIREDDTVIAGELDASTAPRLDAALTRARPPIRLDLAGVTFIDSACINVLVRHHRRLHAVGGDLQIVRSSGSVTRILELTGLSSILAAAPPTTDPESLPSRAWAREGAPPDAPTLHRPWYPPVPDARRAVWSAAAPTGSSWWSR